MTRTPVAPPWPSPSSLSPPPRRPFPGRGGAGPPDPRHRGEGARLRPSRRRREALHPRELRRGEGARLRLHREPLPDRAGLRGADREAARRLRGAGRPVRPRLAERPPGPATRRAGLHRPGRLPRGHEDPGEGPRVDVPLPLRRGDGGDVAPVRAGGDPARLRLRRRAQAALRRPRGRRREPGQGHDQRHPQRDRGGSRREARARRDDQGLRLLGEVVGQAAVGEGGLREVGAGAGHPGDDRRGRGSGRWRATRAGRSSGSSTSGRRGAGRA